MDTQLVEKIVHEVKSQGVFDEFRKDSMADVDTKPAYQNLRQRVETTVKKFLAEQTWTPETNKNQLREKLRRHITESGFLDVGVERIVDQVVNPKICTMFQPRIEEISHKYLGLAPLPRRFEPPPPPLMHALPPLPLPPPPLTLETCSLLPNDLEQVSPDSDKATVKSGIEGDDNTEVDMETDEKIPEDEEDSPPFEPLIIKEDDKKMKLETDSVNPEHEDSTISNDLKKENSENNFKIKEDLKEEIESQDSNIVTPEGGYKEVSQSLDCRVYQDSHLSSVSSDTRLTPETKNESTLQRTSQEQADTANISEEAQMPKFSENSNDPNSISECKIKNDSELHFDIKKDEIRFEGTERKTNMDNNSNGSTPPEEMKCSSSDEKHLKENDKNLEFKFSSNMETHEDDGDRTPIADELSFGSSMENSTSISPDIVIKKTTNYKEKFMYMGQKSPRPTTPKLQKSSTPTPIHTPTATPSQTSTATPTPPRPFIQNTTPTPSPVANQKTERDQQSSRHSSSSSSSKNKKHSKESRRSHDRDRDRDKDRHRSSSHNKDSKYHGSSESKSESKSKHYSSSSTKNSSSSSYNKSSSDRSRDKYIEKSSSTKNHKHSSSSDKRLHSKSSSHRHRSSSSSTTSAKRSDRKDDHYEAKHKTPRRKSTDSNDDDNEKGSGRRLESRRMTHSAKGGHSVSKSKSIKDVQESSYNNNKEEVHNDSLPMQTVNNEDILRNLKSRGNVVFLSNILENPETRFIELDTHGHSIATPQSTELEKMQNSITENHIEESSAGAFKDNEELENLQNSSTANHIDESSASACEDKEARDSMLNSSTSNHIDESSANACKDNEALDRKLNSLTVNHIDEPSASASKDNHEELSFKCPDLMYFEDIQTILMERYDLLNETMDLCRRSVNSLRFDSPVDEGIELSSEDDLNRNTSGSNNCLSTSLKRKLSGNYEEIEKTPRKHGMGNKSEESKLKTSPSPSDSSVNSKENEEIDKNTDQQCKKIERNKAVAALVQKLSRQQRYSSDDLYKPRPILGQRSSSRRRRRMESII